MLPLFIISFISFKMYIYIYIPLYSDMGKSTQYRNWAITWDSSINELPATSRDGLRVSCGGYDYMLYVGPKESPDAECSSDHQHIMVHCETANVSKTKAKEALVAYSSLDSEVVQNSVSYISKIYSTKSKYLIYCFKTLNDEKTHADDDIVKDAITDIKQHGVIPTSSCVKRKLIDDHGANAFNKRFCRIIETYMNETDVIDTRGNPIIIMDKKQNATNFVTQMLYYYYIIIQTKIETACKPFHNLPQNVLKDIVYLISLLPYFTKRVVGINDSLPSLFLYGIQCSGKSSMFNNCRYIKKIATDSSGVSRYRMDKMHTAILFDDITNNIINHKDNVATLKQLTLGNDVEVKINGSTQSIKAFVIITSNEKPSYLDPPIYADPDNKSILEVNAAIVNNSWRRRFISIEFFKQCPFDLSVINYDDLSLRDIAAEMFRNKFTKIMSTYPTYEYALKPFQIYYDVALNDYGSETNDCSFEEILDLSCDIVNESIAELTEANLMDAQYIKTLHANDVHTPNSDTEK